MNYDKKRKRQAGRQARKVQDCYRVWIDEAGIVSADLVKARDYGKLGKYYMKQVTQDQFTKDYPQ